MNKCNSCTLATAIEIHETTLGDKNQKDSKLIFSGYKANVEWIITLRWKDDVEQRCCGAIGFETVIVFTLKYKTISRSGYSTIDKNIIVLWFKISMYDFISDVYVNFCKFYLL